ncbi:bifunctional diaminohydroxyphosphoribosylaminopyrimidine deaminase/5-amino-6-(5-phosphoribosylamino)uracil reductase RibD [Thiomicrorhabdus sp.]|uniref:bifunctional diaminohydroxyphosphoribosylaminopyrimidine deaminase/5-amino-6-(5-phosphoribosylamino)uracil reductase RibD n=1 Tax=Thiomicrorhabdus sp. TaxID=2039724 RepID=UPI0029C8A277|nr:bifunctional diaminohydroxyphosphoribosylaminopyrimidine deaminase/5-amino-6-(5-phosphoribosylamino)uracil reductase RibD [Thiomicrorhabdus sp.]
MHHEFSAEDRQYMQLALSLAAKGLYSTKPNPAVGCVLVKNGEIVGSGWHRKAGELHAERLAMAEAGEKAKGSTAYVTLEPCSHYGRTPPCADGLIEAGVARVVIAAMDPNPLVAGRGVERLSDAGIHIAVGLFEKESLELNKGFIKRMNSGLPYVRLKMASSLDGRTAMANGESQWITGAESRLEVHKMRALSGALITGIGTVLADDPSMTVRLPDEALKDMNLDAENCHPIRVVLDPNLSMPLDAKMLQQPGRTILMTSKQMAEANPALVAQFYEHKVELVAVAAEEDRLDIESVLSYLAQEEHINDVMVESGAIVAGAFISSGFVDELHSFIAPSLLGDEAKPMFFLPQLQTMNDKIQFRIESVDRFGEDIRLVLTKAN